MLTGPMITIFSLVILCIYFFPAYFIYQFSVYSKRAILDRDTEDLDKAMKFLNFYFRFIGILAIVVLSMMVIVILFAGLAAAFFTS
jgi:flagellar biosynthesis protein FlhB